MAKKNVVEVVAQDALNLESVAIVQKNFRQYQAQEVTRRRSFKIKIKSALQYIFGAITFFGLTIGMCVLFELWLFPMMGL